MAAVTTGVIRASLLGLLLLCASACVQRSLPPVADRSPVFGPTPDTYRVQPGDTLYSIAWRFGLDYRRLALANGIGSPYMIHPGQRLRLSVTSSGSSTAGAGSGSHQRAGSGAPSGSRSSPERGLPPDVRLSPAEDWRWPTAGAVTRPYGDGNKGIDYRLEPGARVVGAASGQVVYSGKGLGGYRYLVIVKHGDDYLSAYSLNLPVRVEEGERIKGGTRIADMDASGRSAGLFHFEVRKDGDPVNPAAVIGG
jgi:lipoprotein NlpD